MSHIYLKLDVLKVFCEEAFQRFGFTKEEAQIITDVLLLSDKYGIESHGMQRLVRYHKGIRNNIIKVHAKPEIVFETPVSAVIEGHDGMGQLIGVFGMKTAIEKAKKSGMAIVTARNSNHYGIAGYYAKMATDRHVLYQLGGHHGPHIRQKSHAGEQPDRHFGAGGPVSVLFRCLHDRCHKRQTGDVPQGGEAAA